MLYEKPVYIPQEGPNKIEDIIMGMGLKLIEPPNGIFRTNIFPSTIESAMSNVHFNMIEILFFIDILYTKTLL